MSEMARTYLRQAKGFLSQGDMQRASELLERAVVLLRGDRKLEREILEHLCQVYDALGRTRQADIYRQRLMRLPQPVAAAGPVGIPVDGVMFRKSPSRARPTAMMAGIGGLLVVGISILLLLLFRGGSPPATVLSTPVPPVLPVPLATVSASPPAIPPVSPSPVAPPATQPDDPVSRREGLLKENVGLLVVMLRYEGKANGKDVRLDVPIATGTAFAVSQHGTLLTNRHVVDPEDKNFPPTLDFLGMPTVTLRGPTYVVCFSSKPEDQCRARLLYQSDTFDLAALKVDRGFPSPLKIAVALPRQGEDIFACGFPGVVQEMLDNSQMSEEKARDFLRKWQANGHGDLLVLSSPDSFNSTLTKGIVSAAERNIKTVSYLQMDATISPGNSGGPVLNGSNEVVGIATLGIFAGKGNYNFALLMDQLHDELAAKVPMN